MISIDAKKLEHKDTRHKIAKDIVAIRHLESISDKTKETLIRDLLDKKILTQSPHLTESNEKELIPQFEENNLHIDSDWRQTEKEINLYDWWKMKVKVNLDWDVMEFVQWPSKGEQIFLTYDAFVFYACKQKHCSRQSLEKKYLPTPKKLILMAGDPWIDSPKYQKFHEANIRESQLTGYYIPRGDKLWNFAKRSCIWLAGGRDADFKNDKRNYDTGGRSYGFSGRLLK